MGQVLYITPRPRGPANWAVDVTGSAFFDIYRKACLVGLAWSALPWIVALEMLDSR